MEEIWLEENGLLHKTMHFFNIPDSWSAGKVAASVLAVAAGVSLVWVLLVSATSIALGAGLMIAGFALADAMLLVALPAKGISFGPWQPQLFALVVPRSLVAVFVALVASAAGAVLGLMLLAALQTVGLLALVWGACFEPFRLRLTQLQVRTDHLAPDATPIRLLHISDLHVERLTRREAKLLRLATQAEPDLILITGDFLNLSYVRDDEAQADVRHLLAQLAAPHGVYAVLGSPTVDHRDVLPSLLAELPLKLMRDEWLAVDLGHDRQLVLLGLDCSHQVDRDGQNLRRLASQAPNSMPRVLLYHAPDLMPQAKAHNIDLYLCGHTHGGQVRLPWFGAMLTSSKMGKRYEMGLYQEGGTNMYVSRGVGLEGLSAPRVRFLSPPEITLVTLVGRR